MLVNSRVKTNSSKMSSAYISITSPDRQRRESNSVPHNQTEESRWRRDHLRSEIAISLQWGFRSHKAGNYVVMIQFLVFMWRIFCEMLWVFHYLWAILASIAYFKCKSKESDARHISSLIDFIWITLHWIIPLTPFTSCEPGLLSTFVIFFSPSLFHYLLVFIIFTRFVSLIPFPFLCLPFLCSCIRVKLILAGLWARDAEGIMSAGDERLREISASSDIDDVAWWCFFRRPAFLVLLICHFFFTPPISKPAVSV